MKGRYRIMAALMMAAGPAALAGEAPEPPWQHPYTGEEATGENVIALWQFLPGRETQDNSGHGHDLTLRGQARFVPTGRFGSCLESFPADRENDHPQGAIVQNHPSLTPPGAFTLEMWLQAKPEMDRYDTVFLVDKKYFHYAKDVPEANWDYCLYLARTGEHRRRIVAYLGYGRDSAEYVSQELPIEPGRWVHVAFTYDGAGTGRFFFNGQPAGKTVHPGRGPVTPGRYDLVLGDRYGSIHCGFPGYLDQVRLCNGVVPYFTGSLEVEVGGRTAFVRLEKGAAVPLVLTNDTGKPLSQARVQVLLGAERQEFPLPDLAPHQSVPLSVPVDTALRPDRYPLQVTASARAGDSRVEVERSFAVVIVPRPLPNQMPVVLWGSGDFPRLKEIGFTHQLVSLVDYAKVWEAGKPTEAMNPADVQRMRESLDEHLVQGIGAVVYVYPASWVASNEALKSRYQRVDRRGNAQPGENVCGNFPEIRQFAYNVGASVAQTFGSHPALQAALIHSEVRDATSLCFHPHDQEAFRQWAGQDIPAEVVSKNGFPFSRIKGFPPTRVIPDDHPILQFYRWFWKDGDGWNPLHTQVHRGLKSTGREDLWTFFDPAVRVPSLWGSGGGVDVISQWTYSYPDPIKIGQATDELFAMAAGQPNQQVMKMTQIIWYRSGTAPELPADEFQRAQWEKEIPDAQFITIAPDHLREAFWSKISRPIRGIMYHGWQSLVDAGASAYRYTHPRTKEVLAELIRQVVRPLGPTLLQVPDRPSDVALLESFTSQMFAGRGTYGWGESWEADLHLILQWAHLQPRIIYEETVLREGLDGYRVLVMPCCDVLPESVVRRIQQFQRAGGLLVGDEFLTPALTPDLFLASYRRSGRAQEDKAALQAKAAELRRALDPFYQRYGDSSSPDVVIRFRQYRHTDYLFALNDRRTFGRYVGHHGRVMEEGVPTSATLSVRRRRGHVYDLVNHAAVPVVRTGKELRFEVDLGPGDGRVFLILDSPIAGVQLQAPERGQRGRPFRLQVAVVDPAGKPLPAVVPVEVEVRDPQGRLAEGSGYYGAADGRLTVELLPARNDLPGRWTLRVRELASGQRAQGTLMVAP
jgi:hypothetical protein